jgi:putative ABC transport system permease protein
MRRIFREAIATAVAQPIASGLAIIVVAVMVSTVLLTAGRTVGAEDQVLTSIDSAGTRSIVVRVEAGSGLDTTVLDRLANIVGAEWVGAFGPPRDVTNHALSDGAKVPARVGWSLDFRRLGVGDFAAFPFATAWASPSALTQLGLGDPVGSVSTGTGNEYALMGRIDVPDYLAFLEPLVVLPSEAQPTAPQPVSVLVVIAARPDLVRPLADAVQSLLAIDDPAKVSVATSEDLATLRALVEGQLGAFGRNLVLVVLALTGVLVGSIVHGLVVLRRRDFGRRRALGASQLLVAGLVLSQVAVLGAVGATLGVTCAALILTITHDPLPSIDYFVAVSLLSCAVSVVAAVPPAIVAARRDPARELRVP